MSVNNNFQFEFQSNQIGFLKSMGVEAKAVSDQPNVISLPGTSATEAKTQAAAKVQSAIQDCQQLITELKGSAGEIGFFARWFDKEKKQEFTALNYQINAVEKFIIKLSELREQVYSSQHVSSSQDASSQHALPQSQMQAKKVAKEAAKEDLSETTRILGKESRKEILTPEEDKHIQAPSRQQAVVTIREQIREEKMKEAEKIIGQLVDKADEGDKLTPEEADFIDQHPEISKRVIQEKNESTASYLLELEAKGKHLEGAEIKFLNQPHLTSYVEAQRKIIEEGDKKMIFEILSRRNSGNVYESDAAILDKLYQKPGLKEFADGIDFESETDQIERERQAHQDAIDNGYWGR